MAKRTRKRRAKSPCRRRCVEIKGRQRRHLLKGQRKCKNRMGPLAFSWGRRHDCGIFTIKYAEYLLHDDKDSMPIKFDAGRIRLDIATRLYKHRSIA